MLNEAYKMLIRENVRKDYVVSIGQMRVHFGKNTSGCGYSSQKRPLRPQVLFVDENACIEILLELPSGWLINFLVSVDSCPENCIHWVDREELPVLKFLIHPQPEKGYGVFEGGWERPANVFMAAKAFNKQLQKQAAAEFSQRTAQSTFEEETLLKPRLGLMLVRKLRKRDSLESGISSNKYF